MYLSEAASVYEKQTIERNGVTIAGAYKEVTASLALPKLIARIWTTKQIGEEPIVKVGNKVFDYEQIFKFVEACTLTMMGRGYVFLVPSINSYGGLEVDTITKFNTKKLSFYEESGELQQLEYVRKETLLIDGEVIEKDVKHEHYMKKMPIFTNLILN